MKLQVGLLMAALAIIVGLIVVLGIVFTILAICMDGTVAMLASQARAWFGRSPVRLGRIGAAGGVMMIGLGTTMLVTGRRAD